MKLKFKIILLSSTLLMGACENASETVVGIPSVRLGCTTSDSADCSSSNLNTITGLVRMTRSGCDALNFDPVATGSTTMSCDGSGCEGTITSWTNPETSSLVSEVLTGSMDICSQVDLDNSSGVPNTGDLTDDSTENISSSDTITIDQWSVE